jgi:hypothetical protein
MKKLIASALVLSLLAGCGSPLSVTEKGVEKTYPTYGLFNSDVAKSDKMCYEVSVGNVVWSIILIETVVMPVYFIGWSLFNPVKTKPESGKCDIDA